MSIENILKESADLEEANKGELGITRAYDETPDKSAVLPYSIRYPDEGDYEYGEGRTAVTTHWPKIEVRVARGLLAQAEKLARPFMDKYLIFYAKHMTLGGKCDLFRLVKYRYGKLGAEGEYIGVIFDVEIKESKTVEYGK